MAATLRIDLNELPPKKSAADKVRLAAMMTQMTSVSNAWLARRLQMGVPGSVTQYVRWRWQAVRTSSRVANN
jgi:hypothetical protein